MQRPTPAGGGYLSIVHGTRRPDRERIRRAVASASKKRFVLGVDLDDTCADFTGGLRKVAAEWLGVPLRTLTKTPTYGFREWGVDKAPGGYAALHKFAVTERNLFAELKPLSRAPQTLRKLSDADVRIRIITHRLYIKYCHEKSVQQTVRWLDSHDIPYWDLCFMKDKTAVGADVYIDDNVGHVEALRAKEFPTIVFSTPSNGYLDGPRAGTWDEVFDLVMAEMEMWKAANVDELAPTGT